jgi:transcriptional regulator with XRE-family HTH domain
MATRTVPKFTLTDRLIKARKVAGLDQQDLADRLGLSRKTINRYETKGDLRFDAIVQWAAACDVDHVWLLVGDGKEDAVTEVVTLQEPRDIAGQIQLFPIDLQFAA